jgi:hypothetical protein
MKWRNPTRFLALTGAALLLAMYPFASSKSWACSVAGSSNFSHGSQADDTAVIVCAKSTSVTTAKSKPVKQPAPKQVPKSTPRPIVKPLPKVTAKPAPKPSFKPTPRLSPKPTPKPTPKLVTATKVSKAQARFTPAPVQITASNQAPEVGEFIDFETGATVHFRTASLLGREAEVRFTPIDTTWSIGDGASTSGSELHRSFGRAGLYRVLVKVAYRAEYRFAGEATWFDSGTILVRDSIDIKVGQQLGSPAIPISGPQSRVLLVAENCSVRRSAFGCNG